MEPRARDLGPALGVDRLEALAERQVVLRLEALRGEVPRSALAAQLHGVLLATGRHPVDDEVGQLGDQGVEGEFRLVGFRLERLDGIGQGLGLRDELRLGLLVPLLGDGLAERLLLGAGLLERGERPATGGIGGEDLVDERLLRAASALGGLECLGMVSELLDVDHDSSLHSGADTG